MAVKASVLGAMGWRLESKQEYVLVRMVCDPTASYRMVLYAYLSGMEPSIKE